MFRILLFCFLCFWGNAQVIDVNDLSFSNDFEKEKVLEFKETKDHLAVLIASSGRGNPEILKLAQDKFEELYLSLNPEKLLKKSPKKQIKKIFNAVQDDFLIRYNLENEFIEIFESGRYNCVSSTATYALLLDRFNISYVITEEPQHVYLTAIFDEISIVLEGTDPQSGYLPITDKLQEAQIKSLLNRKLITEEELNSPNAEQIINDLFPSTQINLEQLVGVQYENLMVFNFEKENYEAAFQNALKALYFYDSDRYRNMAFLSGITYLEILGFEDPNYAKVLGTLERMDTSKVHFEEINRLGNGAMASLQVDGKQTEMSLLYRRLKKELRSAETLQNADVFHSLLSAEFFNKKGQVDSAYFFARRAMNLDSANLFAPELLINTLFRQCALNKFENAADTLGFYYLKYGSLRANQLFLNTFMKIVLVTASIEIGMKNYSTSLRYLSRFEELSRIHPDIIIEPSVIESAYSRVAMYEFNRNKNKAIKTLNRGLKYHPNSGILNKVKSAMNH